MRTSNTFPRMKKCLLVLLLLPICYSCSFENSAIKKSLKNTINPKLVKEYKLQEYKIIETITVDNLTDSIYQIEAKKNRNEKLIDLYLEKIQDYKNNIADCERQKRKTLSWLRSDYDMIISDYERMQSEAESEIEAFEKEDKELNNRLRRYKTAIEESKSPIIYYVIQHNYTIRGANKNEIVYLDTDYCVVK